MARDGHEVAPVGHHVAQDGVVAVPDVDAVHVVHELDLLGGCEIRGGKGVWPSGRGRRGMREPGRVRTKEEKLKGQGWCGGAPPAIRFSPFLPVRDPTVTSPPFLGLAGGWRAFQNQSVTSELPVNQPTQGGGG